MKTITPDANPDATDGARDITATMARLGAAARAAASTMAAAPTAAKDHALRALATGLRANVQALQVANAQDLQAARDKGDPRLTGPMLDRLKLTPAIIETVALGCEQLAAMPDPVGEITGVKRRPSGISVGQMRVPHGGVWHDLREPAQRDH